MISWFKNLFRQDRLFGATRNPKWRSVREHHILLNPKCAVCDKKGKFLRPNAVHHIQPFHLNPEKELLESNLITLCAVHHFWVGHLGDFSSWNESVRMDAEVWKKKILNRPKGRNK